MKSLGHSIVSRVILKFLELYSSFSSYTQVSWVILKFLELYSSFLSYTQVSWVIIKLLWLKSFKLCWKSSSYNKISRVILKFLELYSSFLSCAEVSRVILKFLELYSSFSSYTQVSRVILKVRCRSGRSVPWRRCCWDTLTRGSPCSASFWMTSENWEKLLTSWMMKNNINVSPLFKTNKDGCCLSLPVRVSLLYILVIIFDCLIHKFLKYLSSLAVKCYI